MFPTSRGLLRILCVGSTSLSIACVQSVIATVMVKAKEFYVDALGLKMTKERRGTMNEKL
jgi:hypothetical protein